MADLAVNMHEPAGARGRGEWRGFGQGRKPKALDLADRVFHPIVPSRFRGAGDTSSSCALPALFIAQAALA